MLDLSEARASFVCDALCLGACRAGGVELILEVVGVATHALAQLRELGAQVVDGAPADLSGDRWARVRGLPIHMCDDISAVNTIESEVLVVALAHRGLEAFYRRSLVAELDSLLGRDLDAVEFALRQAVDEKQLGGLACA